MTARILYFDEQEVYPLAEERFIKTCGFNLDTEKHKRMFLMGQNVRESGKKGINIRAVLSFYDGSCYKNHAIAAENRLLQCNFFYQIPDEIVRGIYFYMLTVGECLFSSEENIMDFLYADIWGTNYVDSAMHLLRKIIEEDMEENLGEDVVLSEEFGPGYFGMSMGDSKVFMEILQGGRIGVTIRPSGLMIPQKSCTGLFLAIDKNYNLRYEKECARCSGNKQGCKFCRVRLERIAK